MSFSGILATYENFVEILDPESGDVRAKFEIADVGLLSSVQVTKISGGDGHGRSRLTVLANELKGEKKSRLHLVQYVVPDQHVVFYEFSKKSGHHERKAWAV